MVCRARLRVVKIDLEVGATRCIGIVFRKVFAEAIVSKEASKPTETVTKKEAARKQITAAIEHYNNGEYECAITLAGAAEGQLISQDSDGHLFNRLKEFVPAEFKSKEWMDRLNAARDWLKHKTPQWGDEWAIDDLRRHHDPARDHEI